MTLNFASLMTGVEVNCRLCLSPTSSTQYHLRQFWGKKINNDSIFHLYAWLLLFLKNKKGNNLKKCEIELRLRLYVQELQGESKIRSQKVTVFNRQRK